MLINAQLLATSNMEVVNNAAIQGYKLIYIGDQMEIPKGYNFINAISLTPDYKTICAIIEGNDELSAQMYFEALSTPAVEETFAVIIGALARGNNIMIYFPQDTLQLKYPYMLLQYMSDRFGIRAGDKNNPCIYNPAFDPINFRLMYIYRIVPWKDYILSVDELDPIVLLRLREDLCKLFNIPESISDQDMVIKVQQIKDKIIAEMNKKSKLFEKVNVNNTKKK